MGRFKTLKESREEASRLTCTDLDGQPSGCSGSDFRFTRRVMSNTTQFVVRPLTDAFVDVVYDLGIGPRQLTSAHPVRQVAELGVG
jgi:hypothetical protein